MGFTTGAKILASIIDEMANGLIATPGGYWTDNDTTWNTNDKTANNARRSLKYTNALETMYIALEAGIGLGALFAGWVYQDVIAKIPMLMYGSAVMVFLSLSYVWIQFRKDKKSNFSQQL